MRNGKKPKIQTACNLLHARSYAFHNWVKYGSIYSNLVTEIKTSSNDLINSNHFTKQKFYWQEGYGAFSYSKSALDHVTKYIINQKEHHKKRTFKDEYIEFLVKFEVDYQEKYLFEFYE